MVVVMGLGALLLGAGSTDSGVITLGGSGDSPIVGIERAGTVVCSGVLVDARVVVTASACLENTDAGAGAGSICVDVGAACVAPSATSVDPTGTVAALTLPADQSPTPIPYGRSDAPPAVGDALATSGFGDVTAPALTILSTDGHFYIVSPGSSTFTVTDLGSPGTFTPETSDNGDPVDSVYGILTALPTASSPNLRYTRLDPLARGFLDPIVQGTRDVELPGGCSVAKVSVRR